jgi:hypothetical protein
MIIYAITLCLYAPSIWTNTILSYCAFPGSGSQKSFVELNKLLSGVTIAQGGVLPNIQAVLLPKKTQKAKQ